jgi:hypothetical protein
MSVKTFFNEGAKSAIKIANDVGQVVADVATIGVAGSMSVVAGALCPVLGFAAATAMQADSAVTLASTIGAAIAGPSIASRIHYLSEGDKAGSKFMLGAMLVGGLGLPAVAALTHHIS